jgi:hypothetical protein
MPSHLETFATWLRQDMALSDDIEIVIDRAAIPGDRKQKPTTRWDHLAKQQSFSMPKVPSRRRLCDTTEEDKASPTSFCLSRDGSGRRLGGDGDEGAPRPGMGVKQASLSSLPKQTSYRNLTKDEQMQMPRLSKQSSFKSRPRGLCEDDKQNSFTLPNRPSRQNRRFSTGGPKPLCEDDKQNSFTLPNRPSRPNRRFSGGGPKPIRRPKLPFRTDDSDETTDIMPSMPRLAKQTSFTVGRQSSRGPLIGDDEKGAANGTDRQQWMAKQNSFTSPRRSSLDKRADNLSSMRQRMAKQNSLGAFDYNDEMDEKIDTLSSMISPRLEKQRSFVARLSPRGPLLSIEDDENEGTDNWEQMAMQHSCPTLNYYAEDEPAEISDTLSNMLRLVKHAKQLSPDPRLGRSIARTKRPERLDLGIRL